MFRLLPKWEFSHIGIHVKNFCDLRQYYSELLRNCDNIDATLQCKKVLKLRHAPLCQHVLKRGDTPPPVRGALWSYVLGSNIESHVKNNYIYA